MDTITLDELQLLTEAINAPKGLDIEDIENQEAFRACVDKGWLATDNANFAFITPKGTEAHELNQKKVMSPADKKEKLDTSTLELLLDIAQRKSQSINPGDAEYKYPGALEEGIRREWFTLGSDNDVHITMMGEAMVELNKATKKFLSGDNYRFSN